MNDVVIDLCAIPSAAFRVHRHAPEAQPVSSLARPLAVTGALIAAGVGVAYAACAASDACSADRSPPCLWHRSSRRRGTVS